MKSVDDAKKIMQDHVGDYQDTCKTPDGQPLSNTSAFFSKLNPFGKRHGGENGLKRASAFISAMNQDVQNQKITCTEQLINFAVNYADKGSELSKFIWKAIREIAGFTEEHLKYLTSVYYEAHQTGWPTNWPDPDECQAAVENFIHQLICGHYEKQFLKKLQIDLEQKEDGQTDHGKALLNYLNRTMPSVELGVVALSRKSF